MKKVTACMLLVVIVVLTAIIAVSVPVHAQGIYIYGDLINVDIPENYIEPDWSGHLFPKYSLMYEAIFHTKFYPVWSPDGEWIVFTDGKYGMWKVSVNGGEPVLIYDNYDMHYWEGKPVTLSGLRPLGFSPDGSELAYMRMTINENEYTEIQVDSEGSITEIRYPYPVIESLNLDTGETRVVAGDALTGSWSHDGKYFAYIMRADYDLFYGDIVVLDTSTGKEQYLGVDATTLSFSSDDSYIVYSDDFYELYKIPFDGGVDEQLTSSDNFSVNSIFNIDAVSSPDGEWVAFYGNFELPYIELFVLNTFSGEIFEIFPDENEPVTDPLKEERSFQWPRWSPDGKRICYVLGAWNHEYSVNKYDLYIVDFDMKSQRPTGVETATPSRFSLVGNHPNPFNPTTTIEFSLPEAGFAELIIYNVMGQKVRELVSGTMTEGIHSVDWNGLDVSGLPVSAGVYISRLTMSDAVTTGRMLLMK